MQSKASTFHVNIPTSFGGRRCHSSLKIGSTKYLKQFPGINIAILTGSAARVIRALTCVSVWVTKWTEKDLLMFGEMNMGENSLGEKKGE